MNDKPSTNPENKEVTSGSTPESVSETTPSTTPELSIDTTPEPVIETNFPASAGAATTKNVVIRNYAVATLIIALMGSGLWLVLESQGRVQTNFLGSFTSRADVATVNGVKITREAYDKNRQQVEASAVQQGADITDQSVLAEINTQAVETLVNTELLRQEAAKLGITVTSEEIQARYDAIVEQVGGQEALATRMTELSLTEEGLRGDIEGELLIQALFAEVIDVSSVEVSEEEVMQVYTQVSTEQGLEVPFEEVSEVIASNIRLSKEQALVTEYIESLRASAVVDIKI